ncbi:MAG TPA: cell division protein FtsL [Bacillaceae bacterium]|nr:cell division protein FtsL [Bacillaceae bacterium]
MSNLARKYQQHYKPIEQTEVQKQTIRRKSLITPGEKILAVMLVIFLAIMAVQIISSQANVYQINMQIEDTKTAIQEQEKINGDLAMQVSDMSRYEEVWKKAKDLGYKLNADNVKVVGE